jgi:hypothetical protein
MKKHDRDILVLDDNSVWRLGAYGALKASFWAESGELEAEADWAKCFFLLGFYMTYIV